MEVLPRYLPGGTSGSGVAVEVPEHQPPGRGEGSVLFHADSTVSHFVIITFFLLFLFSLSSYPVHTLYPYSFKIRFNITIERVRAVVTRIQEVLSSNLNRDTVYSNEYYFWFSSFSPSKCRESISIEP
jgi:hypothetical protein